MKKNYLLLRISLMCFNNFEKIVGGFQKEILAWCKLYVLNMSLKIYVINFPIYKQSI